MPLRLPSLAIALALSATGCAGTEPCASAACAEGERCVLGTCQLGARVPVGERARRVVVLPDDVAAIAEGLPGGSQDVLPLGSRGTGDAAMFLAFTHGLRRSDDVVVAYVVVEPAAGAPPAGAWVEVEARDVVGRFDGDHVDWARRPATGRPTAVARTRGAPGQPLRVDATALVRGWVRAGRAVGQVALVARAGEGAGAAFSTGLGGGPAPRLEVYLR